VHGDVFRFPPYLNVFCAVVGTGTQILVMALVIFCLSLLGTYYPYNGEGRNTNMAAASSSLVLSTWGLAARTAQAAHVIVTLAGGGAAAPHDHFLPPSPTLSPCSPSGGAMLTSVVVLYALTAGIAGYVSAALYKIMGGKRAAGCAGNKWLCCRGLLACRSAGLAVLLC